MAKLKTFTDVINLWPNGELSKDISVGAGLVRIWRKRNKIPPDYWRSVVDAAEKRGYRGVTLDALAEIAESGGAR